MNAHVSLHPGASVPMASVLTTESRERFISLDIGGVSVFLPDFDAVSANYARALAAELLKAAAEIDRAITNNAAAADVSQGDAEQLAQTAADHALQGGDEL